MATLGKLVVELAANVAKFQSDLGKAARIADQKMSQMTRSVDRVRRSFNTLIGIAGVAGVGYAVSQGVRVAVKSVDDFNTSVIGIAATLTDLSKKSKGADLGDIFNRNMIAAQQMYVEINKEAAEHFASANEMMTVYNRLVMEGYAVRQDEIKALGTLTDRIKLATQGQNLEIQLNQEIRALLHGQERATAAIGLELSAKLGPQWKELVQRHREAGDLLQWIASLYPGLGAANERVKDTLSAQYATLKSILEIISIQGLGGAYKDIVDWIKQINKWLRDNQQLIANELYGAWIGVKGVIETIIGLLKDAYDLTSAIASLITGLDTGFLSQLTTLLQGAGLYITETKKQRFVERREEELYGALLKGEDWRTQQMAPGGLLATERANKLWAYAKEQARKEAEVLFPFKPAVPLSQAGRFPQPEIESRKNLEAAKGTGKSAEATLKRILNLINTWEQEIARLTGSGLAELDAWYSKELEKLEQIMAKSGESYEARATLQQLYNAKRQKLEEDYQQWVAKVTGDEFKDIELQYQEHLQKYKGFKNAEKIAAQEAAQAKKKVEQEHLLETLNLQADYISQIGQLTPNYQEQIAAKARLLDLESQIAKISLDKLLAEKPYLEHLRTELIAAQALTDQYKKMQLAMEAAMYKGAAGGYQVWGYQRSLEAPKREAQATIDMLQQAESQIAVGWGNAIINAMRGRTTDFIEFGWQIAEGFVQASTKYLTAKLFDLLMPKPMFATTITAATLNVATINAGFGLGGGGEGGSWLEGASAWFKNLLGFQHGGSFTVPGSGGIDSKLITFKATPGERISISPPGQSGINVNVHVHGVTDARSFQASKMQIGRAAGEAIMTALQRNG